MSARAAEIINQSNEIGESLFAPRRNGRPCRRGESKINSISVEAEAVLLG